MSERDVDEGDMGYIFEPESSDNKPAITPVDELIARGREMVAEAQPRDVLRISRDDLSALLERGQEAERWLRHANERGDAWYESFRAAEARCVELQHQVEMLRERLRDCVVTFYEQGNGVRVSPKVKFAMSAARAALDGIDQGDEK